MGSTGSPVLYMGCWGAAGIRAGPCLSLTLGQAYMERGNLDRGKTACLGSGPHTCPTARQTVVSSSTEVREKPQFAHPGIRDSLASQFLLRVFLSVLRLFPNHTGPVSRCCLPVCKSLCKWPAAFQTAPERKTNALSGPQVALVKNLSQGKQSVELANL